MNVARVSNPLTLIAVFAGIAEIAATVALPQLELAVQETFVWFVMAFPTLLVLLFFATLNLNAKVLYAPGDYRDDSTFERVIGAAAFAKTGEAELLQDTLWQSDPTTSADTEARLRDWIRRNALPVSLTMFLSSAKYSDERARAARELGLPGKG